MKSWDVIIVGAGIIGLSLAIELRKRGASVLVVERGEPGREASHAAGGMLANCGDETPAVLQSLADASASMYPEFVHELQDESGVDVDLRSQGTLLFSEPGRQTEAALADIPGASPLPAPLQIMDPALAASGRRVVFLAERSVCPRTLGSAALKAARHRGVDISSGTTVLAVDLSEGRAVGVTTGQTSYSSAKVVNCAGAWAGQIAPLEIPTRPIKGQMVCYITARDLLHHVVRSPEIYLIPRSDGRLLAGATVEDVGYDKRTIPDTIQRLERAATHMLPALHNARILEAWAGLRPGTPDNLPILGATAIPGYYVATGHFRDGILLAPITAQIMASVVCGGASEYDLSPFTPNRFVMRGE